MVTAAANELPSINHEHIRGALASSGYRPLSGVECEVQRTSVILTGSLPSFFLKQLAQEIVLRLEGVQQVDNFVTVTA